MTASFTPLIMETSGAFHRDFDDFIRLIARTASRKPGESRSVEDIQKWIYRSLSVAARRGYAWVITRHAARSRFADLPSQPNRARQRLPSRLRPRIY
jgi:hypothetical protein